MTGDARRGPGWPRAATRLVGLLGWPVDHSLSPVMHNAAFSELGLDLVYVALPTRPERLPTVVGALEAVEAAGANVTVPHKQDVVSHCDVLTAEADLVGAVNTLEWTADGLVGDNTDASGLHAVLRDEVGVEGSNAAVMLGTGGAARAAAVALGRIGAPTSVVGRRPDAAESVAELAGRAGSPRVDAVDLADTDRVTAAVERSRLVLNATPLGMEGEPLPDPFQRLTGVQIAYDVVYGAAETPFLRAAREAGAATHHGLGMLVAQAGASFRRWTGQDPPLPTMSAAATAALTS